MNPLVPEKFRPKGVHGDAESWRPSEWKRTFWDLVSVCILAASCSDSFRMASKRKKAMEKPVTRKAGKSSTGRQQRLVDGLNSLISLKEVAMRALALEQRTTDPTEGTGLTDDRAVNLFCSGASGGRNEATDALGRVLQMQ